MSEDVSRFLSQVKELGERRVEEDEARSRELEEKILQDRKERQARRRERARSISPQKSSPVHTPAPSTPAADNHRSERLDLTASPSPPKMGDDNMDATTPLSTSPSKQNELPTDAENMSSNPPSPTRSGSILDERPKSRPLSVVAAENAARSTNALADQEPAASENISRDQIASALSSKDPSWFRQTADRGAKDTETVDLSSVQTQLPGMSRKQSDASGLNGVTSPTESTISPSTVIPPSNLLSGLKLDPPANITSSDATSVQEKRGSFPIQTNRTSPTRSERPPSPTKGMGGFVQSAMLKRSESVNKRWNVQSPPTLQRADTMASTRTGTSSNSRPTSIFGAPTTSILGTPTEPARPDSKDGGGADRPSSRGGASLGLDADAIVPPEPLVQDSVNVTPPVSPSKTMDPRRWSPQKSSWLESALNKPESPKAKPPQPPSNQPAWMAELQKAKAQKAAQPGAESNKPPAASHKHQVSIGGLMRSSAPGINTTLPARGAVHSPSHSTTDVSTPVTQVKSEDLATPKDPSPAKSKSEPNGDDKPTTSLASANKAKSTTPPKKDFRAGLKSTAPVSNASTSQNVEFKNVFGNLRRTTTQNFVAPDELKGNITRGKAALNSTGGPQKSERVDEFKEALLAKKKEFQTTRPEGWKAPRTGSASSESIVPEGILKRAELGRSNTLKRDSASSDVPKAKPDSRRPSVVSPRDSTTSSLSERLERFSNLEKRGSGTGMPKSKPPENGTTTEASKTPAASIPTKTGKRVNESNSPPRSRPASISADRINEPRLPGKLAGSALANRFNPALSNIIARGPPPATSSSGPKAGQRAESSSAAGAEEEDTKSGSAPKLTHMTKSRARGPKRKAPTKRPNLVQRHCHRKRPRRRCKISQRRQKIAQKCQSQAPIAKKSVDEPQQNTPLPLSTATKPPRPEGRIFEQIAAFSSQSQAPVAKKVDEPLESSPLPPSPRKLNMNRMSRFLDSASTEDKGKEEEQQKPVEPTPVKPGRSLDQAPAQEAQSKPQSRSPPINKHKVLPPAPVSLASDRRPSTAFSESIPTKAEIKAIAPVAARRPSRVAATEPLNLQTRPLPATPSRGIPLQDPKTISVMSPTGSPTKQSAETSVVLQDFFGSERPKRKYSVDAAEMLIERPDVMTPKTRTLSAQFFLFTSGRKQVVPAHYERTLFEREMYLCSHSFKNEAGQTTTEVYFWIGDEVSESIANDAILSAAREARSLGGPLIKFKQGKETPGFLQALGGIVITHRGSANMYDSLAPRMLCGRRYHGHVVFDEVDYAPSSLCSGFPYLITQGGKCYLWKGKGSNIDELSCARLIGTDYALSGEMEEVEEGFEPATFWNLFGGANRLGSADHWRLKPNYDRYCSRLFLSDAASKQQIVELPIFTQADLLPTNIYVIDAFFELYIVIGARAQSQYTSFHNALDFAQEYAILAAGMEDRPFVPVSTVVLEGIPRDMKSVFRKWQEALSPTITNTNVGLKRGRSLKIMPLSQALQALGI
ncbi:hypothetical protein GGR50DRAFT_704358 [Xylaria sp. CBS 124048]|nr:hypothetical protein GGR50DRAFT_704358 [Xylaria sp. CBS 124048]